MPRSPTTCIEPPFYSVPGVMANGPIDNMPPNAL